MQSAEYFENRISKVISQNKAIVGVVEPALQKKYHKITGIPRSGNSHVNSATEMDPLPSTMQPIKQSTEDRALLMKVLSETPAGGLPKNNHRPFPTLQQRAQRALPPSVTPKNYSALNLSTDSQPLNLTSSSRDHRKTSIGNDAMHGSSSATASTSTSSLGDSNAATQNTFYSENHHPQNPEGSIIKSVLLNSRGLAVPTTGEGEDAVYTCPLCNISFRSADNLQYHTKCYCQGTPQVSLPLPSQANGSPHSAPISPVASPSHKYLRSNSYYLLPEKFSQNTLAKFSGKVELDHRYHGHGTPLSLAILAAKQADLLQKAVANASQMYSAGGSGSRGASDNFKSSANNSSTPPLGFGSMPTEPQSVSSQCVQITKQLMDVSLPSPGPLLGKTRLVERTTNKPSKETANNLSKAETMAISTEPVPTLVDTIKAITAKEHSTGGGDDFAGRNQKLLQMCGGEITIVEKMEEKVARFGSSGGSIVSISSSPDCVADSPVSMRTGLLSGGSIIETIMTKRKPSTASSSQSAQPILSNCLLSNIFQFPSPINSITAFNPLTLPPKQPEFNADFPAGIEATKIMHGGN